MVSALKALAGDGRTIITVIHQPRSSIFQVSEVYGFAVSPAIDRPGNQSTNHNTTTTQQLFDRLHLLSDGQTIFFGPTHDAVGYFEQAGFRCPPLWNAADFLLDLIATDYRSAEAEKETKARVAGLYLRNVAREGTCTCSDEDYAALAAQAEAAGQGGRWTVVRISVALRAVLLRYVLY